MTPASSFVSHLGVPNIAMSEGNIDDYYIIVSKIMSKCNYGS